MVHSAVSVENEFFCLAKDEDKSITNMKFQKLPYIAHNWSLALLNQPLISSRVWVIFCKFPFRILSEKGASLFDCILMLYFEIMVCKSLFMVPLFFGLHLNQI